VLAAAHRLKSGRQIRTVSRTGTRVSSGCLTLHIVADADSLVPPRAAFVVSKAVGSSVVRHKVQRRLRHVMGAYLKDFHSGTSIVVRARPDSASASSSVLRTDLASALHKAGVL